MLTGATQEMTFAQSEIFGPLAPVFRFETEDEAIAMANDTVYGLAAYAYTRDVGRVFRLNEGLQYGMIGINSGLITTPEAPVWRASRSPGSARRAGARGSRITSTRNTSVSTGSERGGSRRLKPQIGAVAGARPCRAGLKGLAGPSNSPRAASVSQWASSKVGLSFETGKELQIGGFERVHERV